MRSLAYKLTFRAPDRTLTVEEAVAARDAAVASAARADRRGPARRLTPSAATVRAPSVPRRSPALPQAAA